MYFKKIFFSLVLFLLLLPAGCGEKRITPSEKPEDVVKKFYAFIKEGGPTTLTEAYKLVDSRNNVDEGSFKQTVSNYPKDMDVKVVKSTVNDEKDIAVVTIEYRTESSFGGYITTNTDVNLTLDKEKRAWKIDFAGDSYEETPAMYQKEGKG